MSRTKKIKREFFVEGQDKPLPGEIFVFGSNLAGIHGKGAAKTAHEEYDADWKVGRGYTGRSYAIPTKNALFKTLPLAIIKYYVSEFIAFAELNSHVTFFVTRIGCGLAGCKDSDIAPLFKTAPKNCKFDIRWKEYL